MTAASVDVTAVKVIAAAVEAAMAGPTTSTRIAETVVGWLKSSGLRIAPQLGEDIPRGFPPPPGRPPLTDVQRAGNLASLADHTRRTRKEP